MPKKEQYEKMLEAEFEFPQIRREDDPMYVPPTTNQVDLENAGYVQPPNKHYGFYQLCPKCDGWKEVRLPDTSKPMFSPCPICKGEGVIPRAEIKNMQP